MARKPAPRHHKPTARQIRRAVPRHALEPELPLATVVTLAATVAGAVVVASSAYGYSPSPERLAALGSAPISVVASPSNGSVGSREASLARDLALKRLRNSLGDRVPRAASGSELAAQRQLEAEQKAQPAFVSLPSIKTTSSLISLGLEDDGSLEVPVDFLQAGWYSRGPRPGEPGPAVIAGHLDSKIGPGIFSRLADMTPGELVHVTRVDGTVLEFVVTRVDQYPKRAFPTRLVYGPTDAAELRVITCGGSFDRGKGSYDDNIVVFARLNV